jgi:L-seryl-tRNA(Ser) seleniumtransferase
LLLKVHTSNYRVVGFACEVEIEDLVALGRELSVPVVHDLGSGCLVDLAARGLPEEPRVERSVAAGADVVCFSGDKLLGGPQSGILVGRREAIEACRRHPLYRAMRPGRLVYTALEATLRLYRRGEEAVFGAIPVLARLAEPVAEVERRAHRLAAELAGLPDAAVEVVPCTSQAGSGSLPGREVPSRGVCVRLAARSADEVAAALRAGDPAVVARLQDDALLFDARTLGDGEVGEVAARLRSILAPTEAGGSEAGDPVTPAAEPAVP